MSLFAGLVGHGVPAAATAALRTSLSRAPGARVELLDGPGYAFALDDFAIFPGGVTRGTVHDALSVLAGDPLLESDRSGGRSGDFDRLHSQWARGESSLLGEARGSYCAAHYHAAQSRLWLIADKLALRPIYYCVGPGYVAFATALRVLLALPGIPKTGDLQGQAESAAFGYPLGARTQLEHIKCLEPGQVLEFEQGSPRLRTYWHWDARTDQADAAIDDATACADISAEFTRAVQLRVGDTGRAVSLLSGGLDSRCVVAVLRAQVPEVHTIGFGPEGSADQVLAVRAAEAIGTRHFQYTHGAAEFWLRLVQAHEAWRRGAGAALAGPEGRMLWSGEGGDRILAPVNLTEDVIAAMRDGDSERAVRTYMSLEHTGLPRRVFVRDVREHLLARPSQGILRELERRESADRARRFHLYVLLNESRRNIKRHFEDLDLSRFELIMPFYDSVLVERVLRYRLDRFVRHRLYYKLLHHLPAPVLQVPWQAYPGSQPCPLPLPEGVLTQWERWYSREEEEAAWQEKLVLAREVTRGQDFPDWLLDRSVLRLGHLLMRLGLRRYAYLFEVAQPFTAFPPERASLRQPVTAQPRSSAASDASSS
jgi:asparagine synthase (glutamine-hydrolysing)